MEPEGEDAGEANHTGWGESGSMVWDADFIGMEQEEEVLRLGSNGAEEMECKVCGEQQEDVYIQGAWEILGDVLEVGEDTPYRRKVKGGYIIT